jgi:hypothetical protein
VVVQLRFEEEDGCAVLHPLPGKAALAFAALGTEAEVLDAVRKELGDTVADALVASLAAEPAPPEEPEVEVKRGPNDRLN